MNGKKASLGYFRNDQEINVTNYWIFLALSISELFSIDIFYLIDQQTQSFSGSILEMTELNITNSWIFLALFSIDMLDERRIDVYFNQEFVISMHQSS